MSKMIKLEDYEMVVYKFDILTYEKQDSLGKTMKLKELLDLWWNRVEFEYKDSRYDAYKCTNGDYVIQDIHSENNLVEFEKNVLLNKTVKVSDSYEDDYEGTPWTECEIID